MQKYFNEGYARRFSLEEVADMPARYFLPNFGVPKVAKQLELHLVFDVAAKSRGKCLNDFISCGPALQKPLSAVVIRFCEGIIAWSSDISDAKPDSNKRYRWAISSISLYLYLFIGCGKRSYHQNHISQAWWRPTTDYWNCVESLNGQPRILGESIQCKLH